MHSTQEGLRHEGRRPFLFGKDRGEQCPRGIRKRAKGDEGQRIPRSMACQSQRPDGGGSQSNAMKLQGGQTHGWRLPHE